MNRVHYSLWLMALMAGLMGCNGAISEHDDRTDHGKADEVEPAKGSHGGRLLIDGDFALELAIFETGVPPEFRAWSTQAGTPVGPDDVDLHVTLTRLGGVKDEIGFAVKDGFLRGDTVIHEPHSFVVTI